MPKNVPYVTALGVQQKLANPLNAMHIISLPSIKNGQVPVIVVPIQFLFNVSFVLIDSIRSVAMFSFVIIRHIVRYMSLEKKNGEYWIESL